MPINFRPGWTSSLYDPNTNDLIGQYSLAGNIQFALRVLTTGGIPVAVAPTGSTTAAGVLTLGTALPRVYPSIWLYFPAGVVTGDATGGIYYCTMSSTTVGQIYLSTGKIGAANGVGATTFVPFVPASVVTPTTGFASGAFTGSTTETYLVNVRIPAGNMGVAGSVRATLNQTTNNSAGAKTFRTYLGASQLAQSAAYTTSTGGTQTIVVRNIGTLAANTSQIVGGNTTAAAVYTTVNTAVDTFIAISAQNAVATDISVYEGYTFDIRPED